jgi:hypothetical protein
MQASQQEKPRPDVEVTVVEAQVVEAQVVEAQVVEAQVVEAQVVEAQVVARRVQEDHQRLVMMANTLISPSIFIHFRSPSKH